ncbi:MAG: hypothetical protein ACRDRZ_12240 [Pseudonocardiaceae bacterium]
MRMHIELDDDLVTRVDELSGPRGRSAFVRDAIESAVVRQLRRNRLDAVAGAIPDEGHEWDADPGEWVRQQRHGDRRRAG